MKNVYQKFPVLQIYLFIFSYKNDADECIYKYIYCIYTFYYVDFTHVIFSYITDCLQMLPTVFPVIYNHYIFKYLILLLFCGNLLFLILLLFLLVFVLILFCILKTGPRFQRSMARKILYHQSLVVSLLSCVIFLYKGLYINMLIHEFLHFSLLPQDTFILNELMQI